MFRRFVMQAIIAACVLFAASKCSATDKTPAAMVALVWGAAYYSHAAAEIQAAADSWGLPVQIYLSTKPGRYSVFLSDPDCSGVTIPDELRDDCPLALREEGTVAGACIVSAGPVSERDRAVFVVRSSAIGEPIFGIPFRTIVAHELGHCLGFPHLPAGVMATPPTSLVPTEAEKAALAAVYQSPSAAAATANGLKFWLEAPLAFSVSP